MTDSTLERDPTGDVDAKHFNGEETLVADLRASLTPSQIVEQRLISLLQHSSFPVSQVQRRMKPGPR